MSDIIPFESNEAAAIPSDSDINATIDRLDQSTYSALLACKSAVLVACELGAQLLAKKSSLQHGEWLPWIATFDRLSERSVQVYMRFGSNPQRVADLLEQDPSLSIRKVDALLAEDSEPNAENPFAPTSRVAKTFQRIIKFADDDKLGASEEAELLNYWQLLSEKLQRRGLLTGDLHLAQQIAA